MKTIRDLVLVLLTIVLGGCAGGLSGVVQGSGAKATVTYKQEGGLKGTMEIVLEDGEKFTGRYFEPDPGEALSVSLKTGFAANVKAELTGDRGRTIVCWIAVTDRAFGLSTGGRGVAFVSDGQVIDLKRF